MNKITEVTRRDIIELFRIGYVEYHWLGVDEKRFYPYHGRLTEIEFLKKLYPLDKMPSHDTRFDNAESDIWQHTINNADWESDWVFKDDRFELLNGNDTVFLEFLCAIFHPVHRYENGCWMEYLTKINHLIRKDGYELYDSDKISGRVVYSWRKITQEESARGKFMPFSVRNKRELETKTIKLSISKKVRAELLNLFNRYDETHDRTTETNYNYFITTKDAVIEDIKEYYVPKAFDATNKYSKTNDLEQFIMSNQPYCVFDAIELFSQYNNCNNYTDEVNLLLKNNGFVYKLLGGKLEVVQMSLRTNEIIEEVGLRELIEQATLLYNSSNNTLDKQIAVEKLWDAFERLKTYYLDLDKKKSIEKMINEVSNQNDKYKVLFNEEFLKLTDIGNQFRIRHHETDKVDIIDYNYYNYFFQRCFALVGLVLKYLK